MKDLATLSMDSIVEGLDAIEGLDGRVFPVLTEEELVRLANVVSTPIVGVLYNGILSRRTEDKDFGAAAGHMYFTIAVVYKVAADCGYDAARVYVKNAMTLLENIRDYMKEARAANNKPWLFMAESNPVQNGEFTVWTQLWNCAAIV